MRSCLIMLVGLSLATSAMAQDKPVQVVSAADQPSARQLALSQRYVDLAQSEQMEDAIRAIIMAQASAAPKTGGLSQEDHLFLANLTAELTADMMPQMLDSIVPVFARGYTEEELVALVTFYETDVGQSIIDKTYTMMPEMNEAMMAVMPQIVDKMTARMCARFGCPADDLSGASGPVNKGASAK